MSLPQVNAAHVEHNSERLDRMERLMDKVIMLAVGELFGIAVLLFMIMTNSI